MARVIEVIKRGVKGDNGDPGVLSTQAKSANHTTALTERSYFFRCTSTLTMTMGAAATLGDGWHCWIRAEGASVSVAVSGVETINGAAAPLSLDDGHTLLIFCDGSNFFADIWLSDASFSNIQPLIDNPITAAEAQQLQNIGSVTISNAQWGYLGASDQGIATTDGPTFAGITLTNDLTTSGLIDGRDVAADGTKLDTVETNADVTDSANVAAAGAVMESDTTTALMSFVIDEDTMVSDLATKVPTQQSVKAYVDTKVASSVNYRGGYNASTNSPDLDSSPSGVSIGDMYTVTVAGTFFTVGVEVGDTLIAEANNASTEAEWTIVNKNLDAASIKTAYESNSNTNAFTDAEQTKLAGIETAADATDATNVAAAGAIMDGDFTSNGVMKRTGAGTYAIAAAPTGAILGTTDTQTVTNKTIDPSANTIDGDKLDISFNPTYYAPDATVAEADDVDDLAAHLKGIDTVLYDVVDFHTKYLGAKATEPTVDNNGGTLIDGAQFFDTTANVMKVYDLGTTTWLSAAYDSSNVAITGGTITGVSSVVVGGSSGVSPLHVYGDNNTITMQANTASQPNYLLWRDSAGANRGLMGHLSNTDMYLWNYVNGPLLFGVNNSEGMRLTTTGLGIGTSSPFADLHVQGAAPEFRMYSSNTTGGLINFIDQGWQSQIQGSGGHLMFMTGGTTERMRIDSSGRVGIGTTSPAYLVDLENSTGNAQIGLTSSNTGYSEIYFGDQAATNAGAISYDHNNDALRFNVNQSEAMRIESNGRFIVNAASTAARAHFQVDTGYSTGNATDTKLVTIGQGNSALGLAYDGTNGGVIQSIEPGVAWKDLVIAASITKVYAAGGEVARFGAGGTSFVVGSTTANGADACTLNADGEVRAAGFYFTNNIGSAMSDTGIRRATTSTLAFDTGSTERMRINSSGTLIVGDTSEGAANSVSINGGGYIWARRTSNTSAFFGRDTTDGQIVALRGDGVTEGSISISGTTVAYNGAHLSRWFQVPGVDYSDIEDRPEILRGSVLTNLDEMCDWEGEDNEQLNKMEVSSVKGDKNVAGVFQDWDDDDDTYLNDGYCAMTGDFVIRIAADCTVERGDLLMSAGDGTACPQEGEFADVVRSCTVAKVTSINVSHTYDDGSYLVPCVLMAC